MAFDDPTVVQVEQKNDKDWKLLRTIGYAGKVQRFDVPVDSPTDFASVPRVFVWFVPRYGVYTQAAILHDYLWQKAVPNKELSLREADALLRRAMRELGVPFLRRWVMWAAVRLGALKRNGFTVDWLKDLLGVVAIALLVLPVVLPPAALILIALGIFRLFEAIVWVPLKLGAFLAPRLGMKRPPKKVNPPTLSWKL